MNLNRLVNEVDKKYKYYMFQHLNIKVLNHLLINLFN